MLSALIAPALALTLTTTLSPNGAEEIRKVEVAIADLNLADPQGREQLERRLNAAVNKACSGPFIALMSPNRVEQRACLSAAHASYQDQLRRTLAQHGGARVLVHED